MGLNPCGRDSSPLLFVFFNKVLNYSATNLKASVPLVTRFLHHNNKPFKGKQKHNKNPPPAFADEGFLKRYS
jgi:hypothetical protein